MTEEGDKAKFDEARGREVWAVAVGLQEEVFRLREEKGELLEVLKDYVEPRAIGWLIEQKEERRIKALAAIAKAEKVR